MIKKKYTLKPVAAFQSSVESAASSLDKLAISVPVPAVEEVPRTGLAKRGTRKLAGDLEVEADVEFHETDPLPAAAAQEAAIVLADASGVGGASASDAGPAIFTSALSAGDSGIGASVAGVGASGTPGVGGVADALAWLPLPAGVSALGGLASATALAAAVSSVWSGSVQVPSDVDQVLNIGFVKGPFISGGFVLKVYGNSGLIFQIVSWDANNDAVLTGPDGKAVSKDIVDSFSVVTSSVNGQKVISGFRFLLPNYDGPVLAMVDDDKNPATGTYLDEAEKAPVNLDTLMRGFASIPVGGEATIIITPFTEAAIRLAESASGKTLNPADSGFKLGNLPAATINSAQDLISSAIGVDIRDVHPVTPEETGFSAASDQSQLYGLKLAGFSQLATTTTNAKPGEGDVDATLRGLFDALNNAVKDKATNGPDGQIVLPEGDKDKLLDIEIKLTKPLQDYIDNNNLAAQLGHVDVTPPAAPTVNSLYTSDTTPVISGTVTLEAGETLTVVIHGVPYTKANGLVIHDDGTWTLQLPDAAALVDGRYEVRAYVSDAAGHATADESTYELVVDTQAPEQLTIDGADDSRVFGRTEPNATVRIYDSEGHVLAEVMADENGNYEIPNSDGRGGSLWEPGETVEVKAYDEAGNEAGPQASLVDVAPPSLMSVMPGSYDPAQTPTLGELVPLVFKILRTDPNGPARVDWALSGLNPDDFEGGELPSGVAEFADGSDFAEITVWVPASLTQEVSRIATLVISNPSVGFAIDPHNQAAQTLIEDANALLNSGMRFAVSATSQGIVPEGYEGEVTAITYTVRCTGGDLSGRTIKYSVVPSGASIITGNDFTDSLTGDQPLTALPTDVLLTFDETGTATFTLYVHGDNQVGPDEQFRIVLSDLPDGSKVFGALTGKILTDDVFVSVAASAISEPAPGEVTHSFVVTRTGRTDIAHSVDYTIAGVGEQSALNLRDLVDDPSALSGTIEFAPGETERVITLTVGSNVLIAGYETFGLTLQDAHNVTILNATAVSSIVPNLQEIEVTANVDRTLEGSDGADTQFSYTVHRSGNLDQEADIAWEVKTTGEAGVSSADFVGGTLPAGTLHFAKGQSELTLTFASAQDSILEGDESFYIALTPSVPSVRIITPNITGVVLDDESAVGFATDAVFNTTETDTRASRLDFVVERVGFSGSAATVEWRVTPGMTSLDDFVPGQDLLGDNGGYPSGTLQLKPSELNALVRVLIQPDVIYEGDETFSVQLSGSVQDTSTKIIAQNGVSFAGYADKAEGTIIDDDSLVSVDSASATVTVNESQAGQTSIAHITLVRQGSKVGSDWVKWALYPGDTNPLDAQDLSGVSSSAFDSYQKSWIDLVTLEGSQSATGSITLPTSGYVMVSYNRDVAYQNYQGSNIPFDQFVLKNLSASAGVTITALGDVVQGNYVANDVAVTGYNQALFTATGGGGLRLPSQDGKVAQVTISSASSLDGVYFRVEGLDASGNSLMELVKGPDGNTVVTSHDFASVFRVTTIAPGIALGLLQPAATGGNFNDTEFGASSPLYGFNHVTWGSSQLPEGQDAFSSYQYTSVPRHGSDSSYAPGRLVIQSEADLSDATFVVHGGVTVAYFDATTQSVNKDFTELPNTQGGGEFIKLDTPAKVRAEQVAGVLQSADGSSAAHYFMVSGLDEAGRAVSEILAVQDFDPASLAEVTADTPYASGNLLSAAVNLDHAGRVMFSNVDVPPVVLSMALLAERTGADTTNVAWVYLSANNSGDLQYYNGTVWVNYQSWNGIPVSDIESGKYRLASDATSLYVSARDNNWNWPINQQVQFGTPIVFTVTGEDAQGHAITETVTAGSGADDCVSTSKAFASVSSITANRAFDWHIDIGVNVPVETTHSFSEIHGVAPCDVDGVALAGNTIPADTGRFEFTVAKDYVVQGPTSGVALATGDLNYIDSIDLVRHLPTDMMVDIGFNPITLSKVVLTPELVAQLVGATANGHDAADLYRVYVSDYSGYIEFNAGTSDEPDWRPYNSSANIYSYELMQGKYRIPAGDQIYLEARFDYYWGSSESYYGSMPNTSEGPLSNFLLEDVGGNHYAGSVVNGTGPYGSTTDTGNVYNAPDSKLGYVIFYVDTQGATGPATLDFNVDQLGRYGFDSGHVSYAPSGGFSENLEGTQANPTNLLIDPLQVAEHVTVLTLADFTNGGALQTDQISEVYIDGYLGSFQVNDGSAENPRWVDFWNSNYDSSYIYPEDIAAGKFRVVGSAANIHYQTVDLDGNWPDGYYDAHVGAGQVLTRADLPGLAGYLSAAKVTLEAYDYQGIQVNLGTAEAPQWVDYYYYNYSTSSDNYLTLADIDAGKVRIFGGKGEMYVQYYDVSESYLYYAYFDSAPAADTYEPVTSVGTVTLPGSGYIWLRYANVASGNDGADQALINQLYVDGGATLRIAGQKAVSDGVAMTQTLAGAGELTLDGVNVHHSLPQGTDLSKLLFYVSPAEGMTYLPGTQFTIVYRDSNGNEQQVQRSVGTSSTDTPRDGLNCFFSLQGLDVASIDRITYGEQNDSSKLYQSVLHVVQGELTSLASHESVSTVYPSSEASFYAGYSEFIPGAPLVDGNGVHIDAAANSTLGSSLSIAEGSRVVISSNAALTGRSFVITGTDSADQPVTETLTFGADDRLLASTTRWKTVTGVALEAADVTDVLDGYVSVRGSTVYTEPEAIIVRTSSDNQPVFTVHGLDAQGNAVHVRVEGLTDELFQAVGALKEFYGVTFETSGDVGVFHQSTAGSDVDAEGFHSIALTGADNQGQVVFAGGPQRIVLTPDGNGSEHVFRVTGKDATGQTVTEYIHGANPSDNGGSAITVHAFASVSDIAVSVADWWGLEGLSVGTLSPTSLGEDVTLSRFGGEVALGNPVAAFESASQLTFSSADDLSGRTLTIHGIDAVGHAVTEVLTGFQAGGGTLLSVNHYLSVSEIDVSAGGAGAIKVGYMTLGGAMLDNFVVTGSGTAEDPFVGHSLNTLESARLYANASAAANASESDVLLYVDCSGATGPVSLHYNLSLRGTPEQDTLYLEYSGERVPLAQGVAYFADGAGTATVDITIQGDDVKEAIEQGTLVLANASTGVTVDRSHDTAVIKVLNDDDEVSLDVTAQSVVEGTGGETFIEFTLTRTAPGIVKDVAWAIELSNLGQGLTAAQANDFVNGALTGVATFADDATETKVRVAIATDDVYESPESFRVYLPTPQVGSGYALVGNTSAIGTIENDDVSVQVSVNQAEQAEGGSFVFTVSRLGNLSQASHLTWRLVYEGGDDAAAAVDADFTTAMLSGEITIEAGASSTDPITLISKSDSVFGGNRAFKLLIENAAGDTSRIDVPEAPCKIVENDAMDLTVDLAEGVTETEDTTVNEITAATPYGTKTITYVVTRQDTTHALTVDWELLAQAVSVGGRPVNAEDFANGLLPGGTLTFAAGSATANLSIEVVSDDLVEVSEAFTLNFSTPQKSGASQAVERHIVADDNGFGVYTDTPDIVEGNGGGTKDIEITFVRIGDASGAKTYNWELQGQADTHIDATNAADFATAQDLSGTVTFAPGQEYATQVIHLNKDNASEADEAFVVKMLDGTNVLMTSDPIIVRNDDAEVSITVDKSSYSEANYSAVSPAYLYYTITRTGNLDQASTVTWSVDAQTGVTSSDFTASSGTTLYNNKTYNLLYADALGSNGGRPSGTVTFLKGEDVYRFALLMPNDSVFEPGDGAGSVDLPYGELVRVNLASLTDGTSIKTTDVSGTAVASHADTFVRDDDVLVRFTSASLVPQTVNEGDPSSGLSANEYVTLTYTVERVGNTALASNVGWRVVTTGSGAGYASLGGTGAANDFGASSGYLSFAASETTKTFTVQVRKDYYYEGTEEFKVELYRSGVTGYVTEITTDVSGSGGSVLGYIAEHDINLRFTGDTTIRKAEGTAGTTTEYIFTVERFGDYDRTSGAESTYTWRVYSPSNSGYGAVDGLDFVGGTDAAVFPTGTVTFKADENVKTIRVLVQGDGVVENAEAFSIAIDPVVGDPTRQINSPLGVILRDETEIAITNEIVGPGDNTDYVNASNYKAEGDGGQNEWVTHYFKVYRNPSYGAYGDVSATWRLYALQDTADESINNLLLQDRPAELTSADFEKGVTGKSWIAEGQVTIPDGQFFTTLEVRTLGNVTPDALRDFKIQLVDTADAGTTIAQLNWQNSYGIGYVAEDDVAFSIGKAIFDTDSSDGSKIVQEGSAATYRIYRNGDATHAASVDWQLTFPGTASAPLTADSSDGNFAASVDDFSSPTSGTLSFAAGKTWVDLTLNVKADGLVENWAEVFAIQLSNAQFTDGYAGPHGIGIISTANNLESVILNQDAASTVGVTVATSRGDATNYEGNPSDTDSTVLTYTLTRTGNLAGTAQVAWYLTGGSGDNNDIASIGGNTAAAKYYSGYASGNYWGGLVSFADLQSTATVTVTVAKDRAVYADGNETFTMHLMDARMQLSGTSTDFWRSLVGADAGGDTGIRILDEAMNSPDSMAMLVDSARNNVGIQVVEDDVRIYSPSAISVVEGNSGATNMSVTLNRGGNLEHDITLRYEIIVNGTADASDFAASSGDWTKSEVGNVVGTGSFVMEAGKTSQTLSLPMIQGDSVLEGNETFTFRLICDDATLADKQILTHAANFNDDGATSIDTTVTILTDDIHWEVKDSQVVNSFLEGNGADGVFTDIKVTIQRSADSTQNLSAATVNWALVFGNDPEVHWASASDFAGVSGSAYFDYGVQSKEVTIRVAKDRLAEYDEHFSFKITDATVGTPSETAGSKGFVIVNDDSSVRIDDVSVLEGNSGNTTMTFHVTRYGTQVGDTPVTVSYAAGGTASTADFSAEAFPADQTFTFDHVDNAGSYSEVSKTYTVTVKGDTTDEANETFTLLLSDVNDDYVTYGDREGAGTIVNDDAKFSVSAGTPVAEGDVVGGQTFTVTRTMDNGLAQVIHWAVSSAGSGVRAATVDDIAGGAVDGNGNWLAGNLAFAPGEVSKTFTVPFADDAIKELDEVFKVTISAGDGVDAANVTKSVTYGTILNDDSSGAGSAVPLADSQVSLKLDSDGFGAQGVEGHSGSHTVTFTLLRSFDDAPYQGLVHWVLSAGTLHSADGADFVGGSFPSGDLVLPADQTEIKLNIEIAGDSQFESDEQFTLTLTSLTDGLVVGTGTGASFQAAASGSISATGLIVNDDAQFSLHDHGSALVVSEGDATASLTVLREGDTSAALTVEWELVPTATESSVVFGARSGTVTFAAGKGSATIGLTWVDNILAQADAGYTLRLKNPSTGASIDLLANERVITLTNDDIDHVRFSVDKLEQLEGDPTSDATPEYTPYLVTITRENPATSLTVHWTATGSGAHPLPPEALQVAEGDVAFAVGETSKTITVNVLKDHVGDFDRTFDISLSNPVAKMGDVADAMGATISTDPVTLKVLNDDLVIRVDLEGDTNTFVEGSGATSKLVTFTIWRDDITYLTDGTQGGPEGETTVDWRIAPVIESGVASTNMADFGGFWPSGTVTFADGETFKRVQVAISPDSVYEPSEAFEVHLSALVSTDPGARIIVPIDRGFITNDDNGVSLTVDHASVVEGDADTSTPVTFSVHAQGIAGQYVKVYFALEGSGTYPTNADDIQWMGDVTSSDDTLQGYDFDTDTMTGWVRLRVGNDGNAQADLVVDVLGDNIAGHDEQFRLRVTSADNASIVTSSVATTIVNDDSLVAISPISQSKSEGEGGSYTDYTFTVTRTGDTARAAVVDYQLEGFGDNAATDDDFDFSAQGVSAKAGTLAFAGDETEKTITIRVKDDAIFESDERFAIRLLTGMATGGEAVAQIDSSASLAVAVIRNDDLADLILNGIVTQVYEGNDPAAPSELVYEVIRNGDNSQALTVSYTLTGVGGSAAGWFVSGATGTLTLAAGESRGLLTLPVVANTTPESDRSFTLAISATGFTSPPAVDGKIIDDESGISIALTSSAPAEGDSGLTQYVFTVTRQGNTGAVNVDWELTGVGIDAVKASDFESDVLPSGILHFASNEMSKTITIEALADMVVERDELMRVTLTGSDDPAQRILASYADAVIVNDDVVSASGSTIETGDGSALVLGGSGNDTIIGGTGASEIRAGAGDDVIHSGGGADHVYAGDGNDTIYLDADSLSHFQPDAADLARTFVDGGTGFDTVVFDVSGTSIDLTAIMKQVDGVSGMRGIECIDVSHASGQGGNTLMLDASALGLQDVDVFSTTDGSGLKQLMVKGGAGDSVVITDFSGSADGIWAQTGSYTDAGVGYDLYLNAELKLQLLVQNSMNASIHNV